MKRTVLVVEDDRKTNELIRLYLERDNYRVLAAFDGQQALELAFNYHPDLIILDLMLPVIDGLDVCQVLTAQAKLPIIILSARSTEDDKLLGLDLGADDYITKPFSPRELIARVRAVLRRVRDNAQDPPPALIMGELVIDYLRHEVHRGGDLIHLTPKEFRLLEILSRQPGRAFSRLDLLEGAFGYDYGGFERTVDVHIMNLRKKIETDAELPEYIQTVYGIGYKFREEPHD